MGIRIAFFPGSFTGATVTGGEEYVNDSPIQKSLVMLKATRLTASTSPSRSLASSASSSTFLTLGWGRFPEKVLQLRELCPGFLQRKHSPCLKHFSRSSCESFLSWMMSMSMALGSLAGVEEDGRGQKMGAVPFHWFLTSFVRLY